MTKSPSSEKGFALPADLNQISLNQVVSTQTVPVKPPRIQVTRVDQTADAVAATATLTEHRQPPDSQYLTTGLPSKCLFYGFTDNSIGVRRFNNDDVCKIYDARADKSMRMLVEAVGATLDRFSVWDLTVGDFWFLMYWHRINSYPKNPFIVNWTCVSDEHLELIRQNKQEIKSLEQEMMLKRSDLQTVELEEKSLLEQIGRIHHEFGVSATLMRMGDYVRIIEMEEENDAARAHNVTAGKTLEKVTVPYKASDFLLARHASNLSTKHGLTLADRMAALHTLADFSLWPQLDKLVTLGDHGVVEKYHVGCKVCGAKAEVEVALDALTFLPEL